MYRSSSSTSTTSRSISLPEIDVSADIPPDRPLVNSNDDNPANEGAKAKAQSETAVGIKTLLNGAIPVSTGDSEAVVPHAPQVGETLHKDKALIEQIKGDHKAEKEIWVNRFKSDGNFRRNILLFNQKHQELVEAIDSGQVNAAAFTERGKELGTLLMRAFGLADETGWTQQTKNECHEAGCAYAMPSIKLNWESQTPNIVRSAINLGLSVAKEFMPDASWELDLASSAVNYTYVAAQIGVSIVGPFSNAGAQSSAVARQAQWGPQFIPNVNSTKRVAENGDTQILRSPARVKYELIELKQLRAKLDDKTKEDAEPLRHRVDSKLQRFGSKADDLLSEQQKSLTKAKAKGRAVPEELAGIFTRTSKTHPRDELANKLARLEALSANKRKPLILSADQRRQLDRLIDDIKLWRTFDAVLNAAGHFPDDDIVHEDPDDGDDATRILDKAIGSREHELAVCGCYEQLNVLRWQAVGRAIRNTTNGVGAGLGLAINLMRLRGQEDPSNAPENLGGVPEPGPQAVPTPMSIPEPGPQAVVDTLPAPQPDSFNDTLIDSEPGAGPESLTFPLPLPSPSVFWNNASSFMTQQNVMNATSAVVAGAAHAVAGKTSTTLQAAYLGTVCFQPVFYHLTQGMFTGWDYQNKLATQAQIIAMTGTGNLNAVDNPKAAPVPAKDIDEGIHLKKIGGMAKGAMAVRFDHLKAAVDFDSKVYKQSMLAILADASKDKRFFASAARRMASRKDMEAASQQFKLERELEREEIRSRDELRDALGRRASPAERLAFVKSLLENESSTGLKEVVVDGERPEAVTTREASVLAALADYERALKGEPTALIQDSEDSDSDGKDKAPEISPTGQALNHLIKELIPTADDLDVPMVYSKSKTFTYGYGDLSDAFDACTVSAKPPLPGEAVTEDSLKAANAEAEAKSKANREQLINNLLDALDDHEHDNATKGTSDQSRADRRTAVLSILRQYEANLLTAKAAASGDLEKLLGDTSTLSDDGKEMIVGALYYASVPRHLPSGHKDHDKARQAMKTPAYQRAKELDDMLATAKGRTERLSNVNNGHQVSQKLGQYFAYFIAGSGAPMVIKALANIAAEAVVAYNGFDYDNTDELTSLIRAAGNSVSLMGSIMAIGLGFAYQKYIRQKNEFRQRDEMAALPVMVNSSSLHIGPLDFLTRLSDDWLSGNKVTHFRTLVAKLPDTGGSNLSIPEIEFVPYTNLPSDMWTQMFAADLHIIPKNLGGDLIPGQALWRIWRFARATTGELSKLSDEQLAEALNKELQLLKKDVETEMDRDEENDPQVPEQADRLATPEVPNESPARGNDTVIDMAAIRNADEDSSDESSSDSDAESSSSPN